jgi:hypothetical protein
MTDEYSFNFGKTRFSWFRHFHTILYKLFVFCYHSLRIVIVDILPYKFLSLLTRRVLYV